MSQAELEYYCEGGHHVSRFGGEPVFTDEQYNALYRSGSRVVCEPCRKDFTSVVDSGARQEFSTGSVRDTRAGKGRFDLLPLYALTRLARHFENGAVKYGDRNWEKGQELSRYLDSAFRHLVKVIAGHTDEDHASAAVWNLMAFVETQHRINAGLLPEALDDMPYKAGLPL